jgi:hypothetical protein
MCQSAKQQFYFIFTQGIVTLDKSIFSENFKTQTKINRKTCLFKLQQLNPKTNENININFSEVR